MRYCSVLFALLIGFGSVSALGQEFAFSSITTRDEMKSYLIERFPLGTPADELREELVSGGGASIFSHPEYERVEKYIYDINICRIYVWRWNISADFDDDYRLEKLFLNGEAVLGVTDDSNGVRPVAETGGGEKILRGQRPRPEADLGESSLGFIAYDRDATHQRVGDILVIGTGPSRVDPTNLGKMHAYGDVEMWRSIFDSDKASRIVPYSGKCP